MVAYDPVATHEARRMTEGWNGLGFGSRPVECCRAPMRLILTGGGIPQPVSGAIRASLNNAVIFDGGVICISRTCWPNRASVLPDRPCAAVK